MDGWSRKRVKLGIVLSSFAAVSAAGMSMSDSLKNSIQSLIWPLSLSDSNSLQTKNISQNLAQHLWWSDLNIKLDQGAVPQPHEIGPIEFEHMALEAPKRLITKRVRHGAPQVQQKLTVYNDAKPASSKVSAESVKVVQAAPIKVETPVITNSEAELNQDFRNIHQNLKTNFIRSVSIQNPMVIQVTKAEIEAFKSYVALDTQLDQDAEVQTVKIDVPEIQAAKLIEAPARRVATRMRSPIAAKPTVSHFISNESSESTEVLNENTFSSQDAREASTTMPEVAPLPAPEQGMASDSKLGMYRAQVAEAKDSEIQSSINQREALVKATEPREVKSFSLKMVYKTPIVGLPYKEAQAKTDFSPITVTQAKPLQTTDGTDGANPNTGGDTVKTNGFMDPPLPEPDPTQPKPMCEKPIEDRVLLGADVFNRENLVSIHSDLITHSIGYSARWVRGKAPEYLPSVEWRDAYLCDRETPVPMLSQNAAQLLGVLAKTKIQASMGFVIGRVAAGYKVELLDRSEGVIYLNSSGQMVAEENSDSERLFAAINVSPGAHLLYIVAANDPTARAAIGLPVFEGAMTYADATKIQHYTLNGRLLDSASATKTGVPSVWLSAVDQRNQAKTDAKGNFSIKNLNFIGNFPVYLDSKSDNGFTHRFRITLASVLVKDFSLFYFSSARVSSWLNQLEGGVSNESGMLVSAAPGLVSQKSMGEIFPKINTFSANSPILPQAYVLDPMERPLVGQGLNADASRYIGVQIPEGVNIVEIEDKNQNTVWSDLFFSSKGVINVIDPQ